MLGCSSAGMDLGATGSSVAGELLHEAVLVPVEGITHYVIAKMHPLRVVPTWKSCLLPVAQAPQRLARLIAAALTF